MEKNEELPEGWRELDGADGPMAACGSGGATAELSSDGSVWSTGSTVTTCIPINVIANLMRRSGWKVEKPDV